MEEVKTEKEVQVIKIKRIPKAGYFGINSYPKSVTTLSCQLDSKTGAYKTGLTLEEEKYFEKELNLNAGELSKHSKWWGNVFNVEFPIRLLNTKTTELSLDNTINKLKYKVIQAHSKIANSEIERTPSAIFFIDNQEAKAKAELEVFNYEFEGMKMLMALTPEEKKTALRLLGKSGVDTLSETISNAQLMQEIRKDPKKFVDTLTDRNVKTKGLIKELVERNILKKKGNYFIHNDDTIAHSTDECVAYLNDPNHQDIRLILESRLSQAKKAKG